MICTHSGEPRTLPARSGVLKTVVAAVVLSATALLGICSCAEHQTAPLSSPTDCVRGLPECPIDVALTARNDLQLEGRLSPEHSSVSYSFSAKAGSRLQWTLVAPPTRVVLTHPDGNADGPGLPAQILLDSSGRYVFSLSSNTMAENIYGPFRLSLRLLPPQ
jgi:hypothetical protein